MEQYGAHISVIICVYTMQRWVDICEAVDSVRRQTLWADELIIVVDHNPELLETCRAAFADAIVVANDRTRGLSGARNTGISRSTGEIVAFLDDDAVADRDWLAILSQHFKRPEVLGVTSTILPDWKSRRPGWFPEEFLWTVGCTYKGGPSRLQEIRNVQGASALLRRSIFAKAGGFSAGLGRAGAKLPLSCEETELCIRAKAAHPDGCFLFEPATAVFHKVTAARTTWSYFVLRCYAEGLSKAFLTDLSGTSSVLKVERDYVVRALAQAVLRDVSLAFSRFDLSGFKRAGAIFVGLASTSAGFLVGKLSATDKRRAAPVRA
ncbi:glycosyltransferase family 2 protein [Methylocystis parvus]|uniref:Glycosyltransferase family 2 protein n=1 Tax=Methylocystis parvus TaxID=134 RepID=A0A6B8MEI3_9HYPH|nr:glycosyltransferase family 2 protein [Methylocystis parvus]QGM99050.1 glycosyltransferase family 2 protein [Methylocystis parvus]WBK00583.1 glycosyltransferase [Methylocystis parvus OBBP]